MGNSAAIGGGGAVMGGTGAGKMERDGVVRAVVSCRMSKGGCAGCDMMVGIVEGVGAMVGRGGKSGRGWLYKW